MQASGEQDSNIKGKTTATSSTSANSVKLPESSPIPGPSSSTSAPAATSSDPLPCSSRSLLHININPKAQEEPESQEIPVVVDDFDPKPGPSNTAAEFDLEVFDSGSSCSLEDYWLSEVVKSSKTSKDKFGNFKSSKKRRVSKDKSEGSSPIQEFRLRSASFDLDCMEEEGDVQLAPEAAAPNVDNADNSNLGSPMAGPSGLNQNNHGNDEPPVSACPSDDDDVEVELPKDCADKNEVVDSWKCTPSTSKGASANLEDSGVPNVSINDSNSQENIDAIVQDHDNFGTDENEDSMDSVSLEDIPEEDTAAAATRVTTSTPKIQFKLPENNTSSNDCILETAVEMEIFEAQDNTTSCTSSRLISTTEKQALPTITDKHSDSGPMSLDKSDSNQLEAAVVGQKRKSDTLEDDEDVLDSKDDCKKQRLDNDQDETEDASSLANINQLKPSNEVLEWLEGFSKFSRSDKQSAIDLLISSCQPDQVRHMLAVIEPQFQRDFISHLPKEISLYVLSFLSPRDLLRAAQTCTTWRNMCEDNIMWRDKCKEAQIEDFQDFMRQRARCSALSSSNPASSNFQYSAWKSLFMRQHHIETNWRLRPVRQPRVLKGHDDHVITCLQFDDERIVSGSDDNTLKVWSAVTGKCLRTLVGHTGGVWSSQMEGNTIVSGSTDRTLKVWDADRGECNHTLFGHTSTVRCMHLYKKIVVSGSRDASLRMWDIQTGECLHLLVGHVAAVRCVQYNGKLVVSGAYDYMVKVWNPFREECLHTLSGHTNRVYSLQFDGVHVVSGSLDTSIRVWDVETGSCKHALMGHQSLTSGMELRDNILVSGNADSTVKVWDIVSGQCLQTLSGPNKHQSAVTCLQFNSKFVITSSDDGTVKLWDVKTGEFIRDLVALESGGSGGVVWRIRANQTKLVCAVGSRNGTEETKLMVLDFDMSPDSAYGGSGLIRHLQAQVDQDSDLDDDDDDEAMEEDDDELEIQGGSSLAV